MTDITRGLCGAFRPAFFTGVATVVCKLFNIVRPHVAVFGEKDYQQLVTIRRMVADLNLNIAIEGGPVVREPDGLAMSSRNTYLSSEERASALAIYQALKGARELIDQGARQAAPVLSEVRGHIETQPLNRVQYAVLVDPRTLEEFEIITGPTLLALAVFVGRTRLIDNMLFQVDESGSPVS